MGCTNSSNFPTTANAWQEELWDFGDGTEPIRSHSDGNWDPRARTGYSTVTHSYEQRGDYIVRVERSNERGESAIAHLHLRVEP